ncbi:unnamed protein product [Caretta caretta]
MLGSRLSTSTVSPLRPPLVSAWGRDNMDPSQSPATQSTLPEHCPSRRHAASCALTPRMTTLDPEILAFSLDSQDWNPSNTCCEGSDSSELQLYDNFTTASLKSFSATLIHVITL